MSILNMIIAQMPQGVADSVETLETLAESVTSTESVSAAATTTAELSVWDLCMKGGFIMIPLALLLVISIYIFIERYIVISRAAREDSTFMKQHQRLYT